MKTQVLITLLCLFGCDLMAQSDIVPKLDLFLCIGQSNMAGRGELLSEDMTPIDNVFLFNSTNTWEPAANPMNKYSNIRKELAMQKMGPVYSFAKEMASRSNKPIGLIVNARGGSKIESWLKGSKDSLYESTLKRIKEALKYGELKAILWHQGCANAGKVWKIKAYPEQLKQLVADLRADLGMPDIPFIIGQLGRWRYKEGTDIKERYDMFNTMIESIPSLIPNSGVVTSQGLTPINDDITDPHFDRESQLKFGKRYADIIWQTVYATNPGE